MAKLKEYPNHSDDPERCLVFFCPGCRSNHPFRVESKDRPNWEWNGSFDLPTFSPSLLCFKDTPSHRCHSFVRDGRIEFLSDCHHELAGQTVDIPDWEDD